MLFGSFQFILVAALFAVAAASDYGYTKPAYEAPEYKAPAYTAPSYTAPIYEKEYVSLRLSAAQNHLCR